MKRTFILLTWFVFLILAGCSSNAPISASPEPTVPIATPTVTPLPTQTSVPTATFTVSPTIYMSPTATPENFVLAERGYDIADVRLSFPREDMMTVTFKYRFDESRKSKTTFIFMNIPPECKDDDNKNRLPYYQTTRPDGLGSFSFKLTLQGVCEADGIQFNIGSEGGPAIDPPKYREFVAQPFRLERNFPTVNSDTLHVENFSFAPTSTWWGKFTFDFQLSEQIPLPQEKYYFTIYGFGPGGSCPFEVRGPLLSQHNGKFEIPLRLPQNFSTLYQVCLDGADKYTYTASYMSLFDEVAGRTVYHHPLNQQFTIFKNP